MSLLNPNYPNQGSAAPAQPTAMEKSDKGMTIPGKSDNATARPPGPNLKDDRQEWEEAENARNQRAYAARATAIRILSKRHHRVVVRSSS